MLMGPQRLIFLQHAQYTHLLLPPCKSHPIRAPAPIQNLSSKSGLIQLRLLTCVRSKGTSYLSPAYPIQILWYPWAMATLNSSEAQTDTPLIRTHTFLFIYFYFWLRWVLAAARGLPLVVVSRGYSSLRCMGFSLQWLFLSWNTGSVAEAHELHCSMAGGIFLDLGSNPCPQGHQGSPGTTLHGI